MRKIQSGGGWIVKPRERKNEVDYQNQISERLKEWNQLNVKTKQMIKIQSLKLAKESNQVNVKTEQMIKIQIWKGWKNGIK